MLLSAASDEFNGGYSALVAGDEGWAGFRRRLGFIADKTDLAHAPAASWQTDYPLPLLREDVIRAAAGSQQDYYRRYLSSEYRRGQQYNLWHDDRTAPGRGTEARVPFLDHRVVEISASVPDRLRPALLWDKAILRRAMEGILPDRIRERPKVPFFYGVGAGHTYRMIMRMLRAENEHLVEQALSAPGAAEHLDGNNIRAVLSAVDTTRASAFNAEVLLRLINLGLLSDLAKSLPRVSEMPAGAVPDRASADITGSQLAAQVAVIDTADQLPVGEYRLQDGESLHRDVLNSTGYLTRDGEIRYEFVPDSETFEALCRLAAGDCLAAVQQQKSTDVVDRIRDDLLQLHVEGLIVAAAASSASSG
jgi:asparagine synthase (glutamine-hydrolysing)